MIVLIDNYDSFTWNLWHFINELGAEVKIVKNNKCTSDEIIEMRPSGIIISPGPCTPKEAGICLNLIEKAKNKCPILGVCLGHQAIGMAFKSTLIKLNPPIHGKISKIYHKNEGIFDLLPEKELNITRYHSLVINPKKIGEDLIVTSWTSDNVIMGIQHKKYKIYGVQFHPESVLSKFGYRIISSFLNKCGFKKIKTSEFEILEKKLIGNVK